MTKSQKITDKIKFYKRKENNKERLKIKEQSEIKGQSGIKAQSNKMTINLESSKWESVKSFKKEWIDNHSDREEEAGEEDLEVPIMLAIEVKEQVEVEIKAFQIIPSQSISIEQIFIDLSLIYVCLLILFFNWTNLVFYL